MTFLPAWPPEHPALVLEQGRRVSYGELRSEVEALRGAFRGPGVVACLCRNDLPSLCVYLAGLDAGVVPLLLPSHLQPAQLDSILGAYRPRYLFGDAAGPGSEGTVRWEGMGRALVERPDGSPGELHPDLALLLPTSGSTGSPKLVRLSRRNLEANADAIRSYLALGPGERAITSLPMHYSYGLSVINSHLKAGASLVMTDRSVMDAAFWKLMREESVTSLAGVPYTYEMLLRLRIERLDMPAVRTLTQAGGRLAADKARQVAQACAGRGIRFFTMYGQTEATARIAYLPPERAVEKAGSIGVAIPGGRLWLEAEDGSVIEAPEEAGQLVYEGPNVSLGYACSQEDLSLGDERHGVLRTGDLAVRDAEGFYRIVGRLNRFVKLYGVRVSLDDVERLLSEFGYTAAATGEDDALRLFVAGEAAVDAEALRTRLAEVLGVNRAGLGVQGLPALPRLSTGKIDYGSLPKAP